MVTLPYYCDNCGAANQAQATACFACGWVLQTAPSAPSLSQPAAPAGTQSVQGVSQQATIPAAKAFSGLLVPNHLLKQRYRIIGQVGKGGFGAVYKATDIKSSNRLVAVKELNPSGQNLQEIAEATEAFKQEAHLLTGLAHQSLPHIYDHFPEAGSWYLVMDFIEGETLEKRLDKARGGRLPIEQALAIGIQLCDVLDYLHMRQQAIIFRDLKPANVMLTPTGHVYLIDFGVARHFRAGQARDTAAFGSPGYAAPEQYGKAQTTPRSDIYSLGATLHQLLTGDDPTLTPFHFAPLHLPGQSMPPGLEELITQMLAINESKRPADMAIVKRELQRIAGQYRRQAWAPGPAVASQATVSPQPTAAVKPARLAGLKLSSLAKQPAKGLAQARRRLFPTFSVSRRKVAKGLVGLAGLAVAGGGIALLLRALEAAPPAPPQPVRLPPPPSTPALGTTRYLVYRGHSAGVDAVAWNPVPGTGYLAPGEDTLPGGQVMPDTGGEAALHNGRIASAGEDRTVQVWDAATGRDRITYHGHTDYVLAVAWSPGGKLIASGSSDKTVKVWEAGQGDQSSVFTYAEHTGDVTAVAWSPDGKRIASGSYDSTVRLWEPSLESSTVTYSGHTNEVTAVAWSPDGRRIASSGWDNKVQVWDAITLETLVTYHGSPSTGVMLAVAWSPDGKRIASASVDGNVQVWDGATGDTIYTYRGHTSIVNAVAWSPDGKRIASASDDQTVQVWNAPHVATQLIAPTPGGNVFTYRGHSNGVKAIIWSADSKLIVSGSEDHTVQVWEAK